MWGDISINIGAVLVSMLGSMVIGALWYSPFLFGNVWLKLVDKKPGDISREEGNSAMALAVIPAIVSTGGLWLLINLTGAASVVDALFLGSLVSVAFSGMSLLNLVFFEDRSPKLTLLNAGYIFVSYNVVSLIITLWK